MPFGYSERDISLLQKDLHEGLKYFNTTGTLTAPFTYNNSMKFEDVPLLKACSVTCQYQEHQYYSGACNNCCTITSKSHPLQRCAGCQLVSYCGRNCQRKDWIKHKTFCKAFQVKNGKNALMLDNETREDQDKWDDAILELELKACDACMEKNSFLETVFSPYSRVCNICKNAKQDKLFDCRCCCVAYCCKAHEQEDTIHKVYCEELSMFPLIDYLIIKEKSLKLPCLLSNVQTVFESIDNNHFNKLKHKLIQEIEKNHNGDLAVIPHSSLTSFDLLFAVQTNHLAFPLTVLFNLQEFGIGKVGKPIQTISSLNVHIVTRKPVFDSSVWEYFMHLLPALMELNISFIIPKEDRQFLDHHGISLERCKDCKMKGRIINYSVYRNYYHMFFSSDEYTEPDVVAVFGNISPGLMYTEDEQEHIKISYGNMTYSKDTLLILTEMTMPALFIGAHQICDGRPTLKMILPPTKNPMTGYFGGRGNGVIPVLNYNNYMCCIQNS